MIRPVVAAALAAMLAAPAAATPPPGLDATLRQLHDSGRLSGAVVVMRGGVPTFAQGYGPADPFAGLPFTPDTPSESGSLAKPVTAALVLGLVRDGRIALDRPVRDYLPEYPDAETRVRHLLSHSAGLPDYDRFQPVAGKTTADFLRALRKDGSTARGRAGRAFAYCNLCYDTLALLAERVTGQSYQALLDRRLFGPAGLRASRLRPPFLKDWLGRAIGYRRAEGGLERADSWDGEHFYGGSNIAFTARDLARLGAWFAGPSDPGLRRMATAPARVNGRPTGLTLGNFYCAADRASCHYTGHHEGFHGFLYWDARREIAVAMLTNNMLAPSLQQRLQRALVAFAEHRPADAGREMALATPGQPIRPGAYRAGGQLITLAPAAGPFWTITLNGLAYTGFPVGEGWTYVPGLDVYLSGTPRGALRWTTLYKDGLARPVRARR